MFLTASYAHKKHLFDHKESKNNNIGHYYSSFIRYLFFFFEFLNITDSCDA